MHCDKCSKNVVFISGECTSCKGCDIKGIHDLMNAIGIDLGKALVPVVDALNELGQIVINEKELAQQRSRDDLKAKRGSLRRGGNMYRSR